MSAPLVVNTTDGTVWTRREGTRGGEALYAPEKCGQCPQFVMPTLTELADHGIAGSADVLPVPVGPEPHPSYDELTDRQKTVASPGTCGRALVTGKPCPDHPRRQPSRVAELEGLQARVAELDSMIRGVNAKAVEAFRDRDAARARVAELETERHSTNEALDDAVQALRERQQRDAVVAEFVAKRAEYITAIRNCHPDNGHDYDRWQGHAAARRQLAELLGLPVAWPPEDSASVAKSADKLTALLAPSQALRETGASDA